MVPYSFICNSLAHWLVRDCVEPALQRLPVFHGYDGAYYLLSGVTTRLSIKVFCDQQMHTLLT
jgi:hypothetical protein